VDLETYARRLLDATEEWVPFAIQPTAVTATEQALAGVVRCRRLLEGMIRVHDAPDLGGLFARTIYETWLTTTYLLLGGDAAHERLTKNDDHERRRFAERLLRAAPTLDHPDLAYLVSESTAQLAAPVPPGKGITTEKLNNEVCRLLKEIGDPNAEWVTNMYWTLFSAESYTTAHGGLGAIRQYMLKEGEWTTQISADSWSHHGNDHRFGMMISAVLGLAHMVGTALGLPVAALEDLSREWNERQDCGEVRS
jgi:hypothetical protein